MILDIIFRKYFTLKNIIFAIALFLFIFFVINFKDVAIMFFASFVIACSLNPIADNLSKKMPRNLASILVVAGFILLICAIFVPVFLLSLDQIKVFLHKLPNYIDNFDEYLFSLPVLRNFSFLADNADNFMEQVSLSSSDVLSKAVDIGKIIVQSCIYSFISLIIIFNLVLDKQNIKKAYLRMFPSNLRKRAEEVGKIISDKLGGYLAALIITSLSVGVVMLIGLLLFGVPYAVLLALICAVFDIVPVIGPACALLICLFAAYESGSAAVVAVICVFALAQLLENNVVRPYVFSKVMHLHPILIFLFLFIASEFFGFMGVIFAPALAALFAVLFEELYLKKLG